MDQKNSESLIKWNASDEVWYISHSYHLSSDSRYAQTGRVSISLINRREGMQVLSIIGDDGSEEDTDCWLDKQSAQAFCDKMQELINQMKD